MLSGFPFYICKVNEKVVFTLWIEHNNVCFNSKFPLFAFIIQRVIGFRDTYSLVCFALFCLVKRIIEYFAKEWSEQKVSITDVVGLYSTYQKYIMIGAPNSYQFREKWTWVFYQKNLQKSKHFFYEK